VMMGRLDSWAKHHRPTAHVGKVSAGQAGRQWCDPATSSRRSAPRLKTVKYTSRKHQTHLSTSFGTRGSQVQILPLRPTFLAIQTITGNDMGNDTPPVVPKSDGRGNFSLGQSPKEDCRAYDRVP
jgi:hypothetical protein